MVKAKHILICFLFVVACQLPSVAQYNDSLKSLLKQTIDDTSRVNVYTELSSISDFSEISEFAIPAIEMCKQKLSSDLTPLLRNFYLQSLAMNYNNLGYGYFNLGDIPKALDEYQNSLNVQTELKDKVGISAALSNIGNVYVSQGYHQKALEYCLKSLECELEINDPANIALAYNNVGVIYARMDSLATALYYYNKSLKIYEDLKNENGIASIFNNLGFMYKNIGELNKALDYYNKSLAIRENTNNKAGISLSLNNIGDVYYKQGFLAKALENYQRGLRIREELKDKVGIATSLIGMAQVNYDLGSIAASRAFAERCLKLSQEFSNLKNILSISKLLIKIYEKLGDYKLAYQMQDLLDATEAQIMTENNKKATVTDNLRRTYQIKMAQDSVRMMEEKQLLGTKIKQERTFAYSLYFGLAAILIFSIFIYNRLRVARNQKKIIQGQKTEVEEKRKLADERLGLAHHQKQLIEEKQNEIVSSIEYAKRIQQAMITGEKYISDHFKLEHFILYKPKDIVSGDFYWAAHDKNKFYLATADCTGHGVPGALMSLLNILFLNTNILDKEIRTPSKILDKQRKDIISALNPTGNENSRDGMDCVLCEFDVKNKTLSFGAANNPLWLIRDGELKIFKGDKMPVGKYEDEPADFTTQNIALKKGDLIYTFTDGFTDQFGGAKNKKFKYSQLSSLLVNNKDLSMLEQKQLLIRTMETWRGDNEQVDDILIIGVKI